MKVSQTSLPDVLIVEPRVFSDERGYFMESYNRRAFERETRLRPDFVQDNHSRSGKGVLRGLHYQVQQAQGKLVRVVRGSIYDVAVDLRQGSPTLGRWVGLELSEENFRQLWIPAGFAHGFLTLAEGTEVLYKATDFYAPEHERCLAWNDPSLGITWPLGKEEKPIVSPKDLQGVPLALAQLFIS